MNACMLTRTRTAELHMTNRQVLRKMWAKVKELHTDIAAVDGPGDVPEPAEDNKSGLGVEVRI